jgi:hypothetical protein
MDLQKLTLISLYLDNKNKNKKPNRKRIYITSIRLVYISLWRFSHFIWNGRECVMVGINYNYGDF